MVIKEHARRSSLTIPQPTTRGKTTEILLEMEVCQKIRGNSTVVDGGASGEFQSWWGDGTIIPPENKCRAWFTGCNTQRQEKEADCLRHGWRECTRSSLLNSRVLISPLLVCIRQYLLPKKKYSVPDLLHHRLFRLPSAPCDAEEGARLDSAFTRKSFIRKPKWK